jgi:hypothetical protein
VVVWEDFDVVGSGRTTTTDDYALWVADAPVGRPFAASRRFERTGGDPLRAVATSANGWCVVAWSSARGVSLAVRPPGGAFGAPVTVTGARATGPVRVGIDDRGEATVLWSEFGGGGAPEGPVRYAALGADGAMSAADLGTGAPPGGTLALAVGSAGDAVAAWPAAPAVPGQGRDEVRVALRPAGGGAFGAGVPLADAATALFVAGAAIDPAGRATVAIHRSSANPGDPGGVLLVQGSTSAAGWDPPQGLGAGPQVRNLRLLSNPRGDRAAIWETAVDARVAPAPAGGTFGGPAVTPVRDATVAGDALRDVPMTPPAGGPPPRARGCASSGTAPGGRRPGRTSRQAPGGPHLVERDLEDARAGPDADRAGHGQDALGEPRRA